MTLAGRPAIQAICGLLVLTLVMACGPQQGGPDARSGELRIAMITPGPVQDGDFNALGAQALEAIKQQTGAHTALSESVTVADAERVAREYLNAGYNVVLFHGAQFLITAQRIAPLFPSASFVVVSSAQPAELAPNLWSIDRKLHRGFYALGVLAGGASKNKKVGYLAGVRLPEFIGALNAVKQALNDYAPEAQVVHAFVGDQNDPVRARQGAAAQINAGADFVVAALNLGVAGVAEAAKAAPAPVLLTTFYTEKRELAPDRLAGSLLIDFSSAYLRIITSIQSGERGGYLEMRPGDGLELGELRHISPEVAQRTREAFAAIAAGRIHVTEVNDRISE